MKILQLHNRYRYYGGEDNLYDSIIHILNNKGHEIYKFERDSNDIINLKDKIFAFKNNIYSRSSKKKLVQILELEKPDIVHIHNLYPLISPLVLKSISKFLVPTILMCSNYRLFCPTSFNFRDGKICELCSNGREYWCVLKNCRKNILESSVYATRNIIARKLKIFTNYVTCFIAPSKFIKQRLIDAGFPQNKIIVIPNVVSVPETNIDQRLGEYIAYVGRLGVEKGLYTLLSAAKLLPNMKFKLAGEGPLRQYLVQNVPSNVEVVGMLKGTELSTFYKNARFLVVPSECFEVFGLVAAEAMSYCLPVIATKMGGLPELVDDGINGLLIEPNNVDDLVNKIEYLWRNKRMSREMGQNGRKKVDREYSEDIYYQRIINAYKEAIKMFINKNKI